MSDCSSSRALIALVTATVLAAGVGLPGPASAQVPPDSIRSAVRTMEQAAGARLDVTHSPATGLVTFMSAAAPIPLATQAGAPSDVRARAFLAAHGPDEVGMEHVRLQQLYGGVPVTAGELTVHLRDGGVTAVNARTLPTADKVDIRPQMSPAQAMATAEALIGKHFGIADATFSAPRLEIF